jgi:hypothetical protein
MHFFLTNALLPHRGLADAIWPDQVLLRAIAAKLLRGDGVGTGTGGIGPTFS